MEIRGTRVLGGLMVVWMWAAPAAVAASLMSADDAAHTAYADGWQNGDNGGGGFRPWEISVESGMGGVLIDSSTTNGPLNPNPQPGDIDVGGRAWGIYSLGGIARATRPFLWGELQPEQPLSLLLDTGPIHGQRTGVALKNASGETRFEFFIAMRHRSLYQQYAFTDLEGPAPDGVRDTGMFETLGGVDVMFELVDAERFVLGVGYHGSLAPPAVFNGRLMPGDGGIDRLEFYFDGTTLPDPLPPDGVVLTSFLNRIQIVPEPGGLALAGGMAAMLRRRRRASGG